MKIPIYIEDVNANQISIMIGDKLDGGYSATKVQGITNGSVSLGSCGRTDEKVLIFNYDPIPWRVVITDQAFIADLTKKEKGYWIPCLIKSTLKIAAESDQLLYLFSKTMEMTKDSAFKDGRLHQSKLIVESLGLDPDNINFLG